MIGVFKQTMIIVCAAGIAIACQTEETATEQGSETDPAVDATAVREAIMAKDKIFADAMVAGDAETITHLYAADAVILAPNEPRGEGADAIRSSWSAALEGGPMSTSTLDSDLITVSAAGDYAYAVGSYTSSGTAPDGSAWSDQGKYLTVWKNVDGDWKIAADIWNSDNAPEGTQPAETAAAE
jgi:uncharacterized protein (TIGR02246 family)